MIDFKNLIDEVTSPVILELTKKDLTFIVETYVSECQFGALLFQTDDQDIRRPLGFRNRTLNKHENIYGISEKMSRSCVGTLLASNMLTIRVIYLTN